MNHYDIKTMSYDVFAIANFFIKKALEERISITPMKLIKLCYIAQGASLSAKHKALFLDNIEAWRYGPVVPDLYRYFKRYSNKEIPALYGYIDTQGNYIEPEIDRGDIETEETLTDVWDHFKGWSGIELSSWTHRKGSAWDIHFNKMKNSFCTDVIPPELIKQEFDKVVKS